MIDTRENLIKHCEDAIVPVILWRNRDTPVAQAQVGECWAKIKAGCAYRIRSREDICFDIDVYAPTFDDFEYGTQEEKIIDSERYETYYLPTVDQLKKVKGGDWY